jgi:hypothetical protein
MPEPPLYKTNGLRAESIVGNNYDLFLRHFQAWIKNESDPGKVEKMFTDSELEIINSTNKNLLKHGFRARYLKEGRIVFAVICSGDKKQIEPDVHLSDEASSQQHAKKMIQDIRSKLDKFYVPF